MFLIASLAAAQAAVILTAYLLGAARGKAPEWASQKSRAAALAEEDALVRQLAALAESGLLAGTAERAGVSGPAASAGGEGR